MLIFSYPQSPFAQPRKGIGGHFIASLTGLVFMMVFGVHWSFLLTPTLLWAIILVLVALSYNNLIKKQPYPTYWI